MLIKKEALEAVRAKYTVGTTVELVKDMADNHAKGMKKGLRGQVTHVDDAGTVHIRWSNGSTLGVPFGVIDEIKIVDPYKVVCALEEPSKLDVQAFIKDAWDAFGIILKAFYRRDDEIVYTSKNSYKELYELTDEPGLEHYGIKNVVIEGEVPC